MKSTPSGGGHPVEELLHERHTDPETVVTPDSGRTGDVRDQLIVNDPHPQDDLEVRTIDVVRIGTTIGWFLAELNAQQDD